MADRFKGSIQTLVPPLLDVHSRQPTVPNTTGARQDLERRTKITDQSALKQNTTLKVRKMLEI